MQQAGTPPSSFAAVWTCCPFTGNPAPATQWPPCWGQPRVTFVVPLVTAQQECRLLAQSVCPAEQDHREAKPACISALDTCVAGLLNLTRKAQFTGRVEGLLADAEATGKPPAKVARAAAVALQESVALRTSLSGSLLTR